MRAAVLATLCAFWLLVPHARAADLTQAETVFRDFCKMLIDTKSAHSKANIMSTHTESGFVAKYKTISPDFEVEVKRNGNVYRSYIGILTYRETKFLSLGDTHDCAVNGLFNRAYDYPVTEIFLYMNGEWHY